MSMSSVLQYIRPFITKQNIRSIIWLSNYTVDNFYTASSASSPVPSSTYTTFDEAYRRLGLSLAILPKDKETSTENGKKHTSSRTLDSLFIPSSSSSATSPTFLQSRIQSILQTSSIPSSQTAVVIDDIDITNDSDKKENIYSIIHDQNGASYVNFQFSSSSSPSVSSLSLPYNGPLILLGTKTTASTGTMNTTAMNSIPSSPASVSFSSALYLPSTTFEEFTTGIMGHSKHHYPGSSTDRSCYGFGPICIDPSQIFYETPYSVALVNIKPVLPGHVLVISRRLVPRFHQLSKEEVSDLWCTAQYIGQHLEKLYDGTSLTLAIQDGKDAGQSVPHVHIHILPRKTNDLPDNDKIYDMIDESGINHEDITQLNSRRGVVLDPLKEKTNGNTHTINDIPNLGNALPSPISNQLVRGKPIGELASEPIEITSTTTVTVHTADTTNGTSTTTTVQSTIMEPRKLRTMEEMRTEALWYSQGLSPRTYLPPTKIY